MNYIDRKNKYGSKLINSWKMNNWHNIAKKNPLKHKARCLKMSLTTMKVKRSWSLDQIYEMICKPIYCPYCETTIPFKNISIDHRQALSDNGLNDISNIQFTCLRCNMLKGKLNDQEFKRLLIVFHEYPEIISIYEKRIAPSLKYWERIIRKGINFDETQLGNQKIDKSVRFCAPLNR